MIPHLSKLEVMFVWKKWWLGLERFGQTRANQTQDSKQVYYLYDEDRKLFFHDLPSLAEQKFFVMCNGRMYRSSNDSLRTDTDIFTYGRR